MDSIPSVSVETEFTEDMGRVMYVRVRDEEDNISFEELVGAEVAAGTAVLAALAEAFREVGKEHRDR